MITITTLVDNTSQNDQLAGEHGLSVYIETGKRKILFDTGKSDLYFTNACKLNINLQEVDTAIISHGHYDHIGGLTHFLKLNSKAKVYLQKAIFDHQYLSIKGEKINQIGYSEDLMKFQDRFIFLEDDVTIDENLIFIKKIASNYSKPKGNKLLFVTDGETVNNDSFEHEMLFAIETDNTLIMFSGCAHNGILNMIYTLKKHFPEKEIKAIHGGLHLIEPNLFTETESDEELMEIAQNIQLLAPHATIYTGHCTGENAINKIKEVLANNLKSFYAGHTITF